jgi:ribosomal protein S7
MKTLRCNKTIYSSFLGFLIKNGNKFSAKQILDKAFFNVSSQIKRPAHFILMKTFSNLNCFVEIKKVKIKRGTHIVPFSIGFKRQVYLVTKWLMESVFEDARKVPVADKLSFEILSILKTKSSKSLLKKNLNISGSIHNRSNIHFRW